MTDRPDDETPLESHEEAMARALGGLDDLPKVPDPDEEMAERMRRLEAKADEVKQRRENSKVEAERKVLMDRDSSQKLGIGLSMAYALIGLPVVGAGVGWLLDRGTGEQKWTGIFVLAGIVLAIAYTVVVLKRQSE